MPHSQGYGFPVCCPQMSSVFAFFIIFIGKNTWKVMLAIAGQGKKRFMRDIRNVFSTSEDRLGEYPFSLAVLWDPP